MSLDQNLFTLHCTPSKEDPHVLNLVDPLGTCYYRRIRIPGQTYKFELYDPGSEALLATATGLAGSSKHKTLELYNPTTVIELKHAGTLTFRWSFKWEDHDFEWKKEECYMVRKPDPPVMVAVSKELGGKSKTTSVQILDYNLNRFDIQDRKGLEIVILTALLTFQDLTEVNPLSDGQPATSPTTGSLAPMLINATELMPPPPPPPKPAPKTGIDRIAEMQALRGEFNEVVVEIEGTVADYAQYCFNLLEDDAMLFITVKSAGAEQVPKVLQVVEEAKRIRHKNSQGEETEMHQYVLYDVEKPKGPKRINLDDVDHNKNRDKYKPPSNLTIHLSKIDIPELQPKPQHGNKNLKVSQSRGKQGNRPNNDHNNVSPLLAVPTPTNLLKNKRVSASDLSQMSTKPPGETSTQGAASLPPHDRHSSPNIPQQQQQQQQKPPSSGVTSLFGILRH